MMRTFVQSVEQRGDPYFRWRGGDVSRVEALFDGVLALALTLVMVSLDVPNKFDQLMMAFKRLPAFAACFGILVMFWYYHFRFHRRYGLEDFPTVVLNAIVLFLILLYVYPMKFVYTMVFQAGAGVIETSQVPTLMILFGSGFVGVTGCFLLMYYYAYRKRFQLELNDAELWVTYGGMGEQALHMVVGLLSIAVAAFSPDKLAPLAGCVYFLIGPLQWAGGVYFAKRIEQAATTHPASERPSEWDTE